MTEAAQAFFKTFLDNQIRLADLTEQNEELRAAGLPMGNSTRQYVWSLLEFYQDRQTDLDLLFAKMRFETV